LTVEVSGDGLAEVLEHRADLLKKKL
jgi:hypothetical protein